MTGSAGSVKTILWDGTILGRSNMNIISNSCIGGEIYRSGLKEEYSNPFIWTLIDNDNIIKLIKNYDKINFMHYTLHKDEKWNFWINIDDLIDVHFVHYHFDKKCKKIKTKGVHIYSDSIWEYIVEKYETRVARMLEKKETPIFILGTIHKEKSNFLTDQKIKEICDLNTNFKILIVSDTLLPETENVKFFKTKVTDDGQASNLTLAREIFQACPNLFRKSDDEIPLV